MSTSTHSILTTPFPLPYSTRLVMASAYRSAQPPGPTWLARLDDALCERIISGDCWWRESDGAVLLTPQGLAKAAMLVPQAHAGRNAGRRLGG
jgi:hypothetical protein